MNIKKIPANYFNENILPFLEKQGRKKTTQSISYKQLGQIFSNKLNQLIEKENK